MPSWGVYGHEEKKTPLHLCKQTSQALISGSFPWRPICSSPRSLFSQLSLLLNYSLAPEGAASGISCYMPVKKLWEWGGLFLPVNLFVKFLGPQALNLIPWVEEKPSPPPGELYQLPLKWPLSFPAVP